LGSARSSTRRFENIGSSVPSTTLRTYDSRRSFGDEARPSATGIIRERIGLGRAKLNAE
jgi:hypothetical protein